MKKHIAILCGGATYEHEVSIITGIQIAEHINTSLYEYSFVYFDKDDQSYLLRNFKSKRDFKTAKRVPVDIVKRDGYPCLVEQGVLGRKTRIDLCYLAFHGGSGESGPIQGFLDVLKVPHTSASQEGSVIAMNKSLTKEVLTHYDISVLPWMSVRTAAYEDNPNEILSDIEKKFQYPLIIKPVHLGSSIGIEIVHNRTELEKALVVAVRTDEEVLVEPALTDFTEYNISVRSNKNELEFSPIEEPIRNKDFLSFDDKYANGSKKTGGMESLDRNLPADISQSLKEEIKTLSKKIYQAARLGGLVRIDFLYSDETLYCTEINPIPGSVSFYLWEAAGEQFKQQITKTIEDALYRHKKKPVVLPYETDIVDKFVS